MSDLSKLGPFRVKDKKDVFRAKFEFFKICWKEGHFRFAFEYLFFLHNIYVISYESTNQAKEARFCYKMSVRTPRILARHRRIWKKWNDPALITRIG
jgi:hypothetical protein